MNEQLAGRRYRYFEMLIDIRGREDARMRCLEMHSKLGTIMESDGQMCIETVARLRNIGEKLRRNMCGVPHQAAYCRFSFFFHHQGQSASVS